MDLPYTIYNLVGRPFHDMPAVTVAAIAATYFVMFGARGAIGFGALAPAVTLTSWLIPPHQAVLLGLVTATLSQVQLLPEGLRHGDWQVSRPILIATFITIAAAYGCSPGCRPTGSPSCLARLCPRPSSWT